MKTLDDYGRTHRSIYDELYPHCPDVDHAADFLAARCGPTPTVLELGIGHGRLAIPLAERGVAVHGIDSSPAMLEWLRERDTTGRITTTEGDFSQVVAGHAFDVVTVVMNTLFALTDLDRQIECLRRMAEQVASDGTVVIEAFDPTPYHGQVTTRTDLQHLRGGLMVSTTDIDPVRQLMLVIRTTMTDDGMTKVREIVRYCWPNELDLMARIAGLELAERFSGWRGEPFLRGSHRHISVYRRAA